MTRSMPEGGPFEVLLAEDNPGDVDLFRVSLRRNKMHVHLHVAKDGVIALEMLRREAEFANMPKPDLIVLDINMPRKNGMEVLQEIKQDPNLKQIPVAILTSSEDELDVLKAYNLHANCFLSKPPVFDEFRQLVRAIEGFWFTIVKLPGRMQRTNIDRDRIEGVCASWTHY